jgi:hypothetical protein
LLTLFGTDQLVPSVAAIVWQGSAALAWVCGLDLAAWSKPDDGSREMSTWTESQLDAIAAATENCALARDGRT